MLNTKSIKWEKNGKAIELIVKVDIGTSEKTAYADGWNVSTGTESYKFVNITVNLDGKYFVSYPIIEKVEDKEVVAKGGFAIIGGWFDKHLFLGEERYNEIMAIIEELSVETEEYKEVKAIEMAKEIEKENKEIESDKKLELLKKNGLCPRCGTFCYGDCTAN